MNRCLFKRRLFNIAALLKKRKKVPLVLYNVKHNNVLDKKKPRQQLKANFQLKTPESLS